ncbi:MAG: hypothetical protein ACXW6R_19105, partial [Candidatus Binatia bacterium]
GNDKCDHAFVEWLMVRVNQINRATPLWKPQQFCPRSKLRGILDSIPMNLSLDICAPFQYLRQ